MIDLLFEGGIQFMSVLTLVFAFSIGYFVLCLVDKGRHEKLNVNLKSTGLFALVFGVLGQTIGLYEALKMIGQIQGSISAQLLAEGIRVSSITTIYGLTIFVVNYGFWVFLKQFNKPRIA